MKKFLIVPLVFAIFMVSLPTLSLAGHNNNNNNGNDDWYYMDNYQRAQWCQTNTVQKHGNNKEQYRWDWCNYNGIPDRNHSGYYYN